MAAGLRGFRGRYGRGASPDSFEAVGVGSEHATWFGVT